MAAADTVRRPAHPQAERRHPERLAIILRVVATEPQQRLAVNPELRHQIPDRADHLLARVGFVAGRDRRVRCEHRAFPRGLERRLQRRSARHLSARQLKHRERSMPLV